MQIKLSITIYDYKAQVAIQLVLQSEIVAKSVCCSDTHLKLNESVYGSK